MQRMFKRLRDEAHELGHWEFPRLARDPEFRDFVGMYIAEGYKRNRNCVSLGNSEPAVIVTADRWIRAFTRNAVGYSIQHHADQNIQALAAFWAEQLRVSADQIRFQRKSNSGELAFRTWRCEYGVITIRTHDTLFRARLQGWIDRLQGLWVDSPDGA